MSMRSILSTMVLIVLLSSRCCIIIAASDGEETPLGKNMNSLQQRTIYAAQDDSEAAIDTSDNEEQDIELPKTTSASNWKNGDIPADGPCEAALSKFCSDITPGSRRAADCLQAVLDDEQPGETSSLNVNCRTQLHDFFQDLALDVTKNVPLATSCREAIKKHCADVDPTQPGALLACLKQRRKVLKGNCQREVFIAQQVEASRFGVDRLLHDACLKDAKSLCQAARHSAGEMHECLLAHTGSLTWECRQELYRQQLETSDDIRLSVSLLRSCMPDKLKFCKEVAPGDAAVKDCLERHRDDPGFSTVCREQLERMLQARGEYFRLDSKIREYCAEDAERWCEVDASSFALPIPLNSTQEEHRVGACLQDYRDELADPRCAARVNHMISLSFEDVRFNHPLALACAEDRKALCGDIPPGSARVIQCLMDRSSEVSSKCQAILFDQEVIMAENIDFNYPLKKACTEEIAMFCGAVPHGHGRVFSCLQHHLRYHKSDYSDSCERHVRKFTANQATDYRLNHRLEEACSKDIGTYCANACGRLEMKGSCGGSVLRCLVDHMESISSPPCQKELLYFMKMQSQDWNSDIFLAEACRADVESLCGGALAVGGDGAVLQCLGSNVEALSKPCRKQWRRVEVLQGSNIDLNSQGSACKDERRAHCPLVKSGEGRVYNCLMRVAHESDFTPRCKDMLAKVQEKRLQNWSTDTALFKACSGDAAAVCAMQLSSSEGEEDDGSAAEDGLGDVLPCLLRHAQEQQAQKVPRLSTACTRHIGRAAFMALQFYKPGLPGSSVCDGDVQMACIGDKTLSDMPLGAVKACLADQLEMEHAYEEEESQTLEVKAQEAAAMKEIAAAKAAPRDGLGANGRKVDPKATAAAISQSAAAGRRQLLSTTVVKTRDLLDRDDVKDDRDRDQDYADPDVDEMQFSSLGSHTDQQLYGNELPYTLSHSCRAFLEVALPADTMRSMQSSLSAVTLAQQIQRLERTLGLTMGTFHDGLDDSTQGITLTGWVAVAGALAILVVSGTGMLWLLGRHLGGNYKTMVRKDPHTTHVLPGTINNGDDSTTNGDGDGLLAGAYSTPVSSSKGGARSVVSLGITARGSTPGRTPARPTPNKSPPPPLR